jgi:nicotinate-nucleotide adenylyltransferase
MTNTEIMRLGIFGGSFDPVHYGHLLLAEACREQAQLDAVWYVPAATAPHKQDQTPATPEQRIDMLRLAIGGQSAFDVCDIELKRGGVSYTVDTLRDLKSQDSRRELFLLLGGDSLTDLPNWRAADEICRLALPVVVGRPNAAEPDFSVLAGVASAEQIQAMKQQQIEMPLIGLSSQDIRRRVAEGRSIRYMTPRAVEEYIRSANLYRQ